MTDELRNLQREITAAHAGLAAKEILLKRLSDEIPRDQAHLNGLLARNGELQQKLTKPSPANMPEFYDNANFQPGQMGDRVIK